MSTVLVVDDEPAIRSILTDALSDAGLHAWAVASGDAALRYIAGHAVDLVLSDIMMPHMSGHELLAILRERRPDLPVVLMSAGVRPDRNQGHAAFLKKPFELDELLAVVARWSDAARRPCSSRRPAGSPTARRGHSQTAVPMGAAPAQRGADDNNRSTRSSKSPRSNGFATNSTWSNFGET